MISRRAVVAMLLTQCLAGAAVAQEFGRASAGQVNLVAKARSSRAGSLSVRAGDARGLEATLSGMVIPDRLWFFGSASMIEGISSHLSPLTGSSVVAADARLDAQLGSAQSLQAAFASASTRVLTPDFSAELPSSFLSLRYDAVLSPNAILSGSASFSRSQQADPFAPVAPRQ